MHDAMLLAAEMAAEMSTLNCWVVGLLFLWLYVVCRALGAFWSCDDVVHVCLQVWCGVVCVWCGLEVLALFRDSQSRDHTVSIFHSSQPIFADSWQLTAVEKTKKLTPYVVSSIASVGLASLVLSPIRQSNELVDCSACWCSTRKTMSFNQLVRVLVSLLLTALLNDDTIDVVAGFVPGASMITGTNNRFGASGWQQNQSFQLSSMSPVEEGGEQEESSKPLPSEAEMTKFQEAYDTLLEEQKDTTSTMDILREALTKIQSTLAAKEDEIRRFNKDREREKNSFVERIAELTKILRQQEEEADEEDNDDKKDRLQREVGLLEGQAGNLEEAIASQKAAADAAKQKLADLEDSMEFQQTAFEKEKQSLQEVIEAERQKLSSLAATYQRDQTRAKEEQAIIQQQLVDETARLQLAEKQWQENQKEFEKEQKVLQEEIGRQKKLLLQVETEMQKERTNFERDRKALQVTVEDQQKKVEQVQITLDLEKATFQKAQAQLELQIVTEQENVAALQQRLEQEKARYSQERDNLLAKIDLEEKRINNVQQQIQKERLNFANEKDRLTEASAEKVRERRLKKRQMHDRFTDVRKELTEIWQKAKRDAKKDQRALTNKYEAELSDLSGSMSALNEELTQAQTVQSELRTLLEDMTQQKVRAREATKTTEARYIGLVAMRKQEFNTLEGNLCNLNVKVKEKDLLLKQYENSFREILKLSAKLTTKRLGNRVTRLFRRRKRKGNS